MCRSRTDSLKRSKSLPSTIEKQQDNAKKTSSKSLGKNDGKLKRRNDPKMCQRTPASVKISNDRCKSLSHRVEKQQDPERITTEKSPGIAKKLKEILTHQMNALLEDAVDVGRLKRIVNILEKETRVVESSDMAFIDSMINWDIQRNGNGIAEKSKGYSGLELDVANVRNRKHYLKTNKKGKL